MANGKWDKYVVAEEQPTVQTEQKSKWDSYIVEEEPVKKKETLISETPQPELEGGVSMGQPLQQRQSSISANISPSKSVSTLTSEQPTPSKLQYQWSSKPVDVEKQLESPLAGVVQKPTTVEVATKMMNIPNLPFEEKEKAFFEAPDYQKRFMVERGLLTPDDLNGIKDREIQRQNWDDYAKNAFLKSASSLVFDMPQYANAINMAITEQILGKDSSPMEVLKGVHKTINQARKIIDTVLPSGEGLYLDGDGRATVIDLYGAAGSMLPFAAGGSVNTGIRFGSSIITAALGAMQNAVPMYNEAIDKVESVNSYGTKDEYVQAGGNAEDYDKLKGKDPFDVGLNTLVIGSGIGTLEALPIINMFKRANNIVGKNIIQNIVKNGAVGGVEEFTQEASNQLFNNLTAREIYETQRKLDAGLYETGGIGFVLGSFMGGSISALQRKMNDPKVPAKERAEAKIAYEKLSVDYDKIQEQAKREQQKEATLSQEVDITPESVALQEQSTEQLRPNRESRRADLMAGMVDLETEQMVSKYGTTIPTKAQVVADFGVSREQAQKMIRKLKAEIEAQNIEEIYSQIPNVEGAAQKTLLDEALRIEKEAEQSDIEEAGRQAVAELDEAAVSQIDTEIADLKTAAEKTTGTAKTVIENKIKEKENDKKSILKESENQNKSGIYKFQEILDIPTEEAQILTALESNKTLTPEEKKILYRQYKRGVMSEEEVSRYTTINIDDINEGKLDRWAKNIIKKAPDRKFNSDYVEFEEVKPETAQEVAAKIEEDGKEEKRQGLLSPETMVGETATTVEEVATPTEESPVNEVKNRTKAELLPEEKDNLTAIEQQSGKNFREIQNVYAKYGEGKPLSEITVEDYNKAEAKRQEAKAAPTEGGIEKAKQLLAEKKAKAQEIKAKKANLGAVSDPFQQAKEEAIADREVLNAYVALAKEYVKQGINNIMDFATELGEDINNTITRAWNKAQHDVLVKNIKRIIDEEFGLENTKKVALRKEKKKQEYVSLYIKELLADKKLSGTLTEAQRKALINAATKVSTFSQAEKYMDYVDKVISNSEYVDALSEAKKNYKDIKKRLKNAVYGNQTSLVQKFLSIDPSVVESKEQLDEYNALASQIKDGKVPDMTNLDEFIARNEQLIEDSEIKNAKSSKTLLSILDGIAKQEINSVSDYYSAKRKIRDAEIMANQLYRDGIITIEEVTEILNGANNSAMGLDSKSAEQLSEEMEAYRQSVATEVFNKAKTIKLDNLTKEEQGLLKFLKNPSKKAVESMSLRDIEKYSDVIDGLEDDFVNKEAYDIARKIERNTYKDRIGTTVEEIGKEAANSSRIRNLIEDAKKLSDKLKVAKAYRWDAIFNTGKLNSIYKTIFSPIKSAVMKADQSVRDRLIDFRKAVKNLNDADAVEVGMIMSEKEYRGKLTKTPDGKVYSWEDLPQEYKNKHGFLLNDPKTQIDSKLSVKEKKQYKDAYDKLPKDANGVIDLEAAEKQLNPKQKKAMEEARKVLDKNANEFNALAYNHGVIVPTVDNYFPAYNRQSTKGAIDIDSVESITKSIEEMLAGNVGNMSFKTGSVNERVGYSYLTDLNVKKVIEAKTKETLRDYHLTNTVKNLFGAIDDVVNSSTDPNVKGLKSIQEALKDRIITELNLRNQQDNNIIKKTVRGYLGYKRRATLGEPTKTVAEFVSNYLRLFVAMGHPSPSEIKFAFSDKFNKLMRDMGSTMTGKINKMSDEMVAEGKSKASQYVDSLITFADTALGRPYFAKALSESYKKNTGKDLQKQLDKELTFEEELEIQDAIADAEIEMGRLLNSQATLQSGSKVRLFPYAKPSDKKNLSNEILGYMQSFSENETAEFMGTAKNLFTGDNESRIKSARNMAAIMGSNYTYMTLRIATMAMLASLFADDKEEAYDQAIGDMVDNQAETFYGSLGALVMSRYSPIYKSLISIALGVGDNFVKKNYTGKDAKVSKEQKKKIKEQQKEVEDMAAKYLFAKKVSGFGNQSDAIGLVPVIGNIINEFGIDLPNQISKISGKVNEKGIDALDPEEKELWDLIKVVNNLFQMAIPNPISPMADKVLRAKKRAIYEEEKKADEKPKKKSKPKTLSEFAGI